MRRFQTADREPWDVVVSRSSWGVYHLLFVPVNKGPVRQIHLEASSAEEAERSLAGMDEGDLRDLFERSQARDD